MTLFWFILPVFPQLGKGNSLTYLLLYEIRGKVFLMYFSLIQTSSFDLNWSNRNNPCHLTRHAFLAKRVVNFPDFFYNSQDKK